ncbi:MAG: hypothetical protein ACYCZF_12095 [Anaerolineae bacterium]
MTPERVSRSDDEKLYQPRIHSRWIRELYRIGLVTGDPITVLVDTAITEFVERRKAGIDQTETENNHEDS